MKFSKWLKLQEAGTDTGQVAVFARPIMMATRRKFVDPILFKKKNHGTNLQKMPVV